MEGARDYANELTSKAEECNVQAEILLGHVQTPATSRDEALSQAGMAKAVGRQLIDAGSRMLQIAEGLKVLALHEDD